MISIRTFMVAAVAVFLASQAWAQNIGCPSCGAKVCRAIPEIKKEKTTCFKVECEEVCVPKVRLPWQKCCPPGCGQVKKIKILKKDSKESETCTYRFEISEEGQLCNQCAAGGRMIRRPVMPCRCHKCRLGLPCRGSCGTDCGGCDGSAAPEANPSAPVDNGAQTQPKPMPSAGANPNPRIKITDVPASSYYRQTPNR